MLRFRSDLLDLSLSIPPRHFFLHSAEGSRVDNCGMVVFNVVFRTLPVVYHDLLGQAVSDVSLVENGVALVFLVCEDRCNRSSLPSSDARRRRNPVVVEVVCYRMSLRKRIVVSSSDVFLAKRDTDLTMMRSIKPFLQSRINRCKSSRLAMQVPVMPSSA